MAITFPQAVAEIKADVGYAFSAVAIERVCAELGHEYRSRVLDPVTTVYAFLLQILHGNTACSNLPHLVGKSFTAAAYVNARTRMPLTLFDRLFDDVAKRLYPLGQGASLWHGHRTWHLDGSSFSMADLPELQDAFGQPGAQKKGCGFPVAHFLSLFHAKAAFLQRIIPAPLRTHDMANAAELHPEMRPGDILIADRAFASFAHLSLLSLQKLHGVFRCHQRQIVNFRPGRRHRTSPSDPQGMPTSRWIKRLGRRDQIVEYQKPDIKPDWMSQAAFDALPDAVVVRELRFKGK